MGTKAIKLVLFCHSWTEKSKKTMDLIIYRSQTNKLFERKTLPDLLKDIPSSLHPKAHRYQSKTSAYNYVVGRIQLKRALESLGLDNDLTKIEIPENGKPSISGLHFNISHSGHQVICGFSKTAQLGIDLERIIPIDFTDFTSMFSDKEWKNIKSADDPMRSFYWFWTRKESIIKALGLTLSYLHQIELDVSSDQIVVDGKKWFLREIDVGEGYVGALCSEEEVVVLDIIELGF